MCTVASGQIWDPYRRHLCLDGQRRRRATAAASSRINNVGAYASPGNAMAATLPVPGAGNLIDPVAQRMMNLFPEPLDSVEAQANDLR